MAAEGPNFHFVCVDNPKELKDRKARRQARSHAVKQALEKKRKLQQQTGDNFQLVCSKGTHQAIAKIPASERPWPQLYDPHSPWLGSALDPLQVLAADSSRLQYWLDHRKNTTEPVFDITDELVLNNFRPIFRSGLHDPALLNATLLTYAFAETGIIDGECLGYHNMALRFIRASMGSPKSAASEATLGAILLLAGMEARLNMPHQVQLHMNAIRQLLQECKAQGVYLTDGIKRAIFWQDLNSSVMTGSSRVVDHTTFAELQWRRDPFTPNAFDLPPGFQEISYLLTEELVEVFKDIHGFQCIRDFSGVSKYDALSMIQIDNHQAFIQSRLVGMSTTSSIIECFRLAAYLSSATLRCKMWRASVIPSYLSLRLLRKLQKEESNAVWDAHPAALAWLLYIGGAFAPTDTIRSEYILIAKPHGENRFGTLFTTWSKLQDLFKQFIWSEVAYLQPVKAFWDEVSSARI